MYISSANKLYYLNRKSASRFFLNLRTKCSKASSISDTNAKVICSLAPSMGHDMDGHNGFNLRVPVILSALEKVKLTPEFRGSEIIQLQNTRSATLEEIKSVHSKLFLYLLDVVIAKTRKLTLKGKTIMTLNT